VSTILFLLLVDRLRRGLLVPIIPNRPGRTIRKHAFFDIETLGVEFGTWTAEEPFPCRLDITWHFIIEDSCGESGGLRLD
jgi:hypothetical protein